MSFKNLYQDLLLAGGPYLILERTLIAEFLLSNGYLMSDLERLPPDAAKSLMSEACKFAALKLAEIESRDKFIRKISLPISLN